MLAQTRYRADQVPASGKADRRYAYATRICASVERMTAAGRVHEVGTVEMLQDGPRRGVYTARFDEDVLGVRTAHFEYGCKALNPTELLMRAMLGLPRHLRHRADNQAAAGAGAQD